jgi:carbonic anhydrase
MSAAAQNLADVVAEFPYVGSRLTPNLEENVPFVHLKEVYVIDCSCPKPPLDR